VISPTLYECQLSADDDSETHPLRTELEAALAELSSVQADAQVAIRSADGLSWTGAIGMADIPNGVPMETCTRSMVGSISKTLTATLIVQLQDEGILDLDDPISDWLSQDLIGELANANESSIRHLLLHTSGIPEYLATEQFITTLNTPNLLETQAEKIRYAYGKKPTNAVGERHYYCNTNYVLLGLIVEQARQMTLWEAVDTYITQPLGLNLVMGTHQEPIPEGTARPYLAVSQTQYRDMMSNAVSDAATGDGGIASSAFDLILFIEALFEERLTSAEGLKEMIESRVLTGPDMADFPNWGEEEYGLGLNRFDHPQGVAFGHTGSTSTYNSFLFYFPDKKVSVAISYHLDGDTDIWDARRALREKIFELLL
ncbi:MAG: serine hydrolase domain-containing protein, partial [Bacteroidota bacterium]